MWRETQSVLSTIQIISRLWILLFLLRQQDIELKVNILDWLSTCIETQPGVIEMFLDIQFGSKTSAGQNVTHCSGFSTAVYQVILLRNCQAQRYAWSRKNETKHRSSPVVSKVESTYTTLHWYIIGGRNCTGEIDVDYEKLNLIVWLCRCKFVCGCTKV